MRFRYGVHGHRRGGFRGGETPSGTKPSPTGWPTRVAGGCTIATEIDNSSTAPPALYSVCQSRVIGDAECANCRRSTTRIYRAATARAGGPSPRTHVRIKTHLDGTIVNAQSIVVTTPLCVLGISPRINCSPFFFLILAAGCS